MQVVNENSKAAIKPLAARIITGACLVIIYGWASFKKKCGTRNDPDFFVYQNLRLLLHLSTMKGILNDVVLLSYQPYAGLLKR